MLHRRIGCEQMVKVETKELLANSLKELLKDNSFASIGVRDIVKNCGISRTAFYNHFQDKYDLISWIYRTESEQICKGFDNAEWREYHTRVLEYMLNEKDYYMNISSYQGQNSIQSYITSYVMESMERHLKRQLGVNKLSEDIETSLYMWNSTRTVLVFKWIRNTGNKSPKEMSNLICNCVPEPIRLYYQ